MLIPRPDTELLIDLSLQFFPPGAAPQILDLCSGSGAIAVTLALERPDATVDALELSTDALEVDVYKRQAHHHLGRGILIFVFEFFELFYALFTEWKIGAPDVFSPDISLCQAVTDQMYLIS